MILHLANDYSGSTVYKNLVDNLDQMGVQQTIYTPIRDIKCANKNKVDFTVDGSRTIYSPILNSHLDRILFKTKVKKILGDVESKVDLKSLNCVHAHTWFSDGGVAYELFKKHNTPYIVAIRNTDLNLFFKYMLHLRNYGIEILKNAVEIIFIAPVYEKRFFELKSIHHLNNRFLAKCQVIPNGVDQFWIKNVQKRHYCVSSPSELLYVGNFSPNKNVMRLLQAVEILNQKSLQFNLKIVGGGGKDEKKVLDYIKKKECFKYIGMVREKEVLLKLFKEADIFTMPSKSETFGLVYVEALSQGIPILFSENEGIDGAYKNVGEKVNPLNIDEIVKSILKISENYSMYDFDPAKIVENHQWSLIANKYLKIYKSIQ